MYGCEAVIITGGRRIECKSVTPNEDLPGFLDIWIGSGKRRVMNANRVIEIIPNRWDGDERFD